ncbi:hypothetical protein B484DRAFT_401087 [Ochromonadaceae sp. CCMP2298]|nr:hypothetical protein B484DRAFT_401087 [Ochromonadaceae sp. CCMP2298]|eukprot:CAMPEP_0173204552 /NCGR_PEP_ID=MMETSP1141-20130122/20185_1 /TAXON_ID=483371 /ORGANISM="non described non described, Strain CCMP2298" /LENGTH=710 /DNA_ID=CAMNT_0014130227 /DNA_START=103 /DNA_END=2235 /DNA_ORIENTATION=+
MSLNLKARGPGGVAASLRVSVDSTFAELVELLLREMKLTGPIDILHGFPPAVVDEPANRPIGEFLSNNEGLRVQLKSSSGQQAQATTPLRKAKAAKPASASSEQKGVRGFGAVIAGVHGPVTAKKRAVGAGVGGSGPVKRRRVSSKDKASSESDLADILMKAVNGGHGTGDKIFRQVFRGAMAHEYDNQKAMSRLNALLSGRYTIKASTTAHYAGTGDSSQLDVSFHKGIGCRSFHEETVDLVPKELLTELLRIGLATQREAINPENLCKCSPRIFWSLVHHYGPSVQQTIKTLLQGVDDCSWMDERVRDLSEKARENLAQQQERGARTSARQGTAAAAGIQSEDVETVRSVEPVSSGSAEQDPLDVLLRETAAASANLDELVPEAWRSALTECGAATILALACAECLELHPALLEVAKKQALSSSSSMSSRGKRGGGDRSGGGSATTAILLDDDADAAVPVNLDSDGSGPGSSAALLEALSYDQVDAWVFNAQGAVAQAVWRLICGGGSDRLRSALSSLGVRKPKDMLPWRHAPAGLLEGLLAADAELMGTAFSWAPLTSGSSAADEGVLTTERISWMCNLCVRAEGGVFTWNLDPEAETDGREQDEEEASAEGDSKDVEEEDWLFEPSAHEFIGRRGRIFIDDFGFWADGTVVAYGPPTEEDAALWKLRIDKAITAGKTVDCSDLEISELEEAFKLYPSTSSSSSGQQ